MKPPTLLCPILLICLAPAILAGCGSHQDDSYTPTQQRLMKSGKPSQVTPDQRAQMEAALRGHMGHPMPANAPQGAGLK